MNLPLNPIMKEALHGHGANGMALYWYEDSEDLGVTLEARRSNRRSAFIEKYRFKWLPDVVFSDYGSLRNAVASLEAASIEAEKAKWPQLIDVKPSRGNSKCWLHRDRQATHSGTIATCWITGCSRMALLCSECAGKTENDPTVIERASDQRRRDVAARSKQGGQL